ncbi:MAG: NAD(P)-dependent oxidoreductase [Gaiellales bacterium]
MTRVAFAGAGTMGRHLIRHLLEAGHAVRVYDPVPAAMEHAAALGADATATCIADICADAEVFLLSMPSVGLVGQVAREAAAVLPQGALLADVSTSPPALAQELAAELEPTGLLVADCPLSGGPVGAEAGSLTSMIGGSDAAYARLEPLAQTWSAFVVHTGGHGTGQAAKLCNNMLAGLHMAGLCLSLAAARRAGLSDAMLFDILSRSTGDSRVMRARFPGLGVDDAHPSNRDFEALFTLDLMTKDMELAEEFVTSMGLEPGLLEAATSVYREAQSEQLGGLDYSGLIRLARLQEDAR